jgi:exosome complex RNA-binding protein Rrp42 (RNase PH superfamily)
MGESKVISAVRTFDLDIQFEGVPLKVKTYTLQFDEHVENICLARMVDRTFRHANLDWKTDKFIRVDLVIINDDGDLYCPSSIATYLSLKKANLIDGELPAIITLGVCEDKILVNPSLIEEYACDSLIYFGVQTNKIVSVLGIKGYYKDIKNLKEIAMKSYKKLKSILNIS